jgi:sortase A
VVLCLLKEFNTLHAPDEQQKIPLGISFIIIGLIILIFVVLIWGVFPSVLPERLQFAEFPTITEPAQDSQAETTALAENNIALLPETPEEDLPVLSAQKIDIQPPKINRPSQLVIPAIGIDAPIQAVGLQTVLNGGQEYLQWQVPDTATSGWHASSAPLGHNGNTVLNGHHNINGEVFRDIVNLEIGDEIIIYNEDGEPFTYRVSTNERVKERGQPIEVRLENAQWIEPTEDERITLITCWPYSTNSHRVIVVAEPVNIDASASSN